MSIQERQSIVWAIVVSLMRAMYEVQRTFAVYYKQHPAEFAVVAKLGRNDPRSIQNVTTMFHCLVTALEALQELGVLADVFPPSLSLEVRIEPEEPYEGGSNELLALKLETSLVASPYRGKEHEAELLAMEWVLVSPPLPPDSIE